MVSEIEALDRAYTYWRITGTRIDVDGIHTFQRGEGNEPCFGNAGSRDGCKNCRWHGLCLTIAETPQVGETLWLSLQIDGES